MWLKIMILNNWHNLLHYFNVNNKFNWPAVPHERLKKSYHQMSNPELKEVPKLNIFAMKMIACSPFYTQNYWKEEPILQYPTRIMLTLSPHHMLNVYNASMVPWYSWSFLIGYKDSFNELAITIPSVSKLG